jgi:hypothetical protein
LRVSGVRIPLSPLSLIMTKPCKNRAFLFHYILIKVPE